MSVAFDTNNMLASGHVSDTIHLWNKNTGELLRTLNNDGDSTNSLAFDSSNILASNIVHIRQIQLHSTLIIFLTVVTTTLSSDSGTRIMVIC